ncbi:hypothetical protein GDO86_008554 [Hymenochirus boettgeri]|uniref:Galanin peptides n=1 Tax=Hymenochirus boettgeri TaxID=247094 RepID=A0A8T2J0V8_9PIPI|nr:hypothetical protein GDO86_008554 [Hymenochirus boettgeri]
MPPRNTSCTLLRERKERNFKQHSTNLLKMQRCSSLILVSLVLCATISQTFGLVLTGKDKRGWTLNSAGYLLGPHAVDNHRSFIDKHGLAGKRDLLAEEELKSGNFLKTLADENMVHTLMEFLNYLHLKDVGALDSLNLPISSEEVNQ